MRNMGVEDFLRNLAASQTPRVFPYRKANTLSYPSLGHRLSE
jgi:hypothetical protein